MKRIHPIFNLSNNSKVSESSSGSQEPDHRKKTTGKSPNATNLSTVDLCAPFAQQSSTSDFYCDNNFEHSRNLRTIIPVEIERDEEDILHFDICNKKSDISPTCELVDEINNQPEPSRRSETVLDPSKLFFPKVPERFTLKPTSSLSSTKEIYVKPGMRFIKKFQKGVSDVKNSHIFNWIKKSKKSECQGPAGRKVKGGENVSSSPTTVYDFSKSCVLAEEHESEDTNIVQLFDQQTKNEYIAIQMEDDESETVATGPENTKWAVNSNVGNEVDSTVPGPSRVNKRSRSTIEQQGEAPFNVKKGDVESDDFLETFRNTSFEKTVKNNPLLNWIKRYKTTNSPTKSETSKQSNGSVNEGNGDFSECLSNQSGVAESQEVVLGISTSSRVQRLVRRLKRKRKIEIELDKAHPQPNDITSEAEHSVPSLALNDEDNMLGSSTHCDSSEPETSPPIDRSDVIIEIDSEEENDENCCMQSIQRCVCGAKEKACVMCSFMERQKRKWDDWNPDLNNPLFMCLAESKLAGLKEAVKPNRGICFRLFFLLVFFVMFGIGTWMSAFEYNFQKNSPLLHAFDTKEIAVRDLPAFGVNVTPHAAFRNSFVTDLDKKTDMLDNKPVNSIVEKEKREVSTLVNFMSHTCEPKTIHSTRHDAGFENPFWYMKFKGLTVESKDDTDDKIVTEYIIPQMKKASPDCEEMIQFCSWNMKSNDPSCRFRSTYRSTGISCAFNTLPATDLYRGNKSFKIAWEKSGKEKSVEIDYEKRWEHWSLQRDLRHMNDPTTGEVIQGPMRQASGNWPWGLSFVIVMDDDRDTACPQFDSSGTRVSITVPGVDIDVERENVLVPANHEVFIKVFAEVTLADEEIRTIPVDSRGCYMDKEYNLTHYKIYNKENCHRECVAEFILRKCECALLSAPNSEGQKLCIDNDFRCVRDAEGEVVRDIGLKTQCPHCLPTCSHMSYRLEVTMTPYSTHHISEMSTGLNETQKIAGVHTFYGPESIVAKVRKPRHSQYELYSEIGSIYETTNSTSYIGYARVFYGIFVAILSYVTYRLSRGCCRKPNVNVFNLKRRLLFNPLRMRQRQRRAANFIAGRIRASSAIPIRNPSAQLNFALPQRCGSA